MNHRPFRLLRHPIMALAALMMVVGVVTPAFAGPMATSSPDGIAQDGATAVIELTAFSCEPGSVPVVASLTPSETADICSEPAAGVDFHLLQGDVDTTIPTDAQGSVRFDFPGGDVVRFFAGVPLEADEALYCTSGPASEDSFQAVTVDETGVSTFDTTSVTQYTCFWYTAAQPSAVSTEISANDVPEASSLELFAFDCTADVVTDPSTASYDDLVSKCTVRSDGVTFHLNTGDVNLEEITNQDGQTSFSYPPGAEVDFYADVPLESMEQLYCSAAQGMPERLERDNEGVFHWANDTVEARTCSWFLVEQQAIADQSTEIPATEAPADISPTQDVSAAQTEDGGQIEISAVTCPTSFDPETAGSDLATLAENCTEAVSGVSFTLGDGSGWTSVLVSSASESLVWSGLEPGTYTLISSVPLESATEYLACQADGGAPYQKEFTAQGVTSFLDLETEHISCTWYIVPENLRGDETGASLVIHLAACPAGFDGSDPFETCHSHGLDGYDFTLDGPDGAQTAATAIMQEDGPGVVSFTSLPAGDYSVTGGPPGDFGRVSLFCSTQPDNGQPNYALDGMVATVSLGENEHVLCDWYFIPDNSGEPTVTPTQTATPAPARAEILVTLFACPSGTSGSWSGASLATLSSDCAEKINDVSFRLGAPSGVPISAATGVSGDGAVRFYDLLPGDLSLTPTLPSTLRSLAVFCSIDGGETYQKALANGGTTFVDVDGESIACSWFTVKHEGGTGGGDTGSITVREYLCDKDRAQISDWDAECTPGSTGTTFTVANTSNGDAKTGTPNKDGVVVFSGLPDGHYTLTQGTGIWCRAVADRVDNQSRVIVQGGGNTDVVLYQCNAIDNLPVTGTGAALPGLPGGGGSGTAVTPPATLGAIFPIVTLLAWRWALNRPGQVVVERGLSGRSWKHRYR